MPSAKIREAITVVFHPFKGLQRPIRLTTELTTTFHDTTLFMPCVVFTFSKQNIIVGSLCFDRKLDSLRGVGLHPMSEWIKLAGTMRVAPEV